MGPEGNLGRKYVSLLWLLSVGAQWSLLENRARARYSNRAAHLQPCLQDPSPVQTKTQSQVSALALNPIGCGRWWIWLYSVHESEPRLATLREPQSFRGTVGVDAQLGRHRESIHAYAFWAEDITYRAISRPADPDRLRFAQSDLPVQDVSLRAVLAQWWWVGPAQYAQSGQLASKLLHWRLGAWESSSDAGVVGWRIWSAFNHRFNRCCNTEH